MRRFAILLLVLSFATVAHASEDGPAFRASAGLGAGKGWPGLEGRFLLGAHGSRWRFGAEGRYFEEFKLFTWPNESIGAGHVVVGWDLLPTGPVSILYFGGLGAETHVRRGRFLASEPENILGTDTYETVSGTGPSLLVGFDLGFSLARRLGLSGQCGIQVAEFSVPYALLQLDVGDW